MIDVYVDGSYSTNDKSVTYGAAVLIIDDTPITCIRCRVLSPDLVKMRNVGGELAAAALGVNTAAGMIVASGVNTAANIKLYYDYTGIYEFVKPVNPWKAASPGVLMYVSTVHTTKKKYPNVSVEYCKVKAHTGNKWNEVADAIAKGDIPTYLKQYVKYIDVGGE